MKFIADLHIHSHFSRATSKTLDPEHIALWAQKKGIGVVGTGDFTHPGWVSELREKLVEAEEGLYRLRPDLQSAVDEMAPSSCPGPVRFLLSGEISCIYKKNGKTRKVHHLILMQDMDSVIRLNEHLDRIGNIKSDGRPILGLDSRDLLEITLEASETAFFIPAHVWTPWFSLFGSRSGFDAIEECFEDLTGHIYALETGLSSDPPMNRLVSALDRYLLVSNSDAHSPGKLGREANLFDTDMDYNHMTRAMTDGKGFMGTIEFYPEEGKYHLDGHRKCRVRLHPQETRDLEGLCPKCGKPLTVGVFHRIHELADRDTPELSKDFFSLIPLPEILSELLSCGPATKKVTAFYEKLLLELGPELRILMDVALSDIEVSGGHVLAEAIGRMRRNQVIREEGYDGEYGVIHLFEDSEKEAIAGQMVLFAQETKKTSRPKDKASRPGKTRKKRQKPTTPRTVIPEDPILDPLNPEQKSAVLHQGGHLLIVAGPGTGKTLTLTHRIAHLISKGIAKPEQVLALTFTRKAAREMGQRIAGLLNSSNAHPVRVSTFHGFCLDILRDDGNKIGLPPEFTLCPESDARALAEQAIADSGMGRRVKGRFLKALPKMKAGAVTDLAEPPVDHELMKPFKKYQNRLRDLGMLDLDDLEVEALRLFRDRPEIAGAYDKKFPWVFVDEYQDTNPIQVKLLKGLIRTGKNQICVIGDPDQAIYGFRGAEVGHFHRFTEDFPGAKEITLTRNYRSTKEILEGAAALMEKEKPLECESFQSAPLALAPCRTESEEAEMIVEQVERLIGGTSYFSLDSGRVDSHEGEVSLGFGDIGVLFRLNAQGDALKEALDRAGIPVVRSGEIPIISRHPVNILWRFFQTMQYPGNLYYANAYNKALLDAGITLERTSEQFEIERPLPDVIDWAVEFHEFDCSSEESVEALRRLKQVAAGFEGGMASFLDTLSLERGIDHALLAGDRVALMSLHAAKGLEWPVVFITGCENQLMPCSLFGNRDDEEERRLFYVGMTRARSRIILSHVKRRSLRGRLLHMNPSPFLDNLPKDLCAPLERRTWKPKGSAHKQLELF